MAFDFPSSPTLGQTFSPAAGITYTWSGVGWVLGAPDPGLTTGTALVFVQPAAPTGWTKQTTHNDKALRLVSGASGGSGAGSIAFSTVFARTAVDNTTLTAAQMASHTHNGLNGGAPLCGTAVYMIQDAATYGFDLYGLASTGGNSPHNHGIDIRVQYVDAIICTKN